MNMSRSTRLVMLIRSTQLVILIMYVYVYFMGSEIDSSSDADQARIG